MEQRITSSAQWAGRATVESRPEEAFLLFAIALESLILGSKEHSELRYRLALRTAYLLSHSPDARRQIHKDIRQLYERERELLLRA